MSHSINKIWIHGIWSTKNREPLIQPNIEEEIYSYMASQFDKCASNARIINGMPDHIHSLFQLNHDISLEDVIKQVKGASSHWINHQDLIAHKFAWQTGYAAFSVSESQLENVYLYIKHQKEHHKKKTFGQELDAFLKLYGLVNG